MIRSRLSAIFYVVLVFASGILVGVASTHLYAVKASARANTPAPRTMDEFRKRYMTEMQRKVGVTEAQQAAVGKILDDTKKKFDDMRRQERPLRDKIQQEQIDGIRAVLTDSQKAAYDSWRTDRQRNQSQKRNHSGANPVGQ